MSLHEGIDTCSYVSVGQFTKNYGAANKSNIANLFGSLGMLEDAPSEAAESLTLRFAGVAQGLVQGITNFLRKILPTGGGHIGRE